MDAMSPAELVEIDRERDGEVVTVQGEAIGESLRAIGGGYWVNLLGDDVGLGVWMTEEMVEEIEHFGGYQHTGDIVRVTGPVHVACARHGGEFDVHAETVEIISRGRPLEHGIVPVRGAIGVVGLAVAFILWRVYIVRRERL